MADRSSNTTRRDSMSRSEGLSRRRLMQTLGTAVAAAAAPGVPLALAGQLAEKRIDRNHLFGAGL